MFTFNRLLIGGNMEVIDYEKELLFGSSDTAKADDDSNGADENGAADETEDDAEDSDAEEDNNADADDDDAEDSD